MKLKKNRCIVVIGMGLIGGSLAKALRKKFPEYKILGLSRKSSTLAEAFRKRIIANKEKDMASILSQADIVFITTPMSAIPEWIEACERHCAQGTIVTDAGSAKGQLVKWVKTKKLKRILFVGGHPMAGSHESGLKASSAKLFEGAVTILTPIADTHRSAIVEVKRLWKALSTKVIVMKPEEHDRWVCRVSHLPHALVSALLVGTPPQALALASTGFRDTTRIGMGPADIWSDIFMSNRDCLLKDLKQIQLDISHLRSMLVRNDDSSLRKLLEKAASVRKRL